MKRESLKILICRVHAFISFSNSFVNTSSTIKWFRQMKKEKRGRVKEKRRKRTLKEKERQMNKMSKRINRWKQNSTNKEKNSSWKIKEEIDEEETRKNLWRKKRKPGGTNETNQAKIGETKNCRIKTKQLE